MSDALTIKRMPKQADEIKTIDDIISDLSFVTNGFPTAAVKAAIEKRAQITPWLIQVLRNTIENPFSVEPDRMDHFYALFFFFLF